MEIRRIGSVLRVGAYLRFDPDQLVLGLTRTDTEFEQVEWVLESLEPHGLQRTFRIRHRLKEDHYLHIETGPLVCEPIGFGANSSYWIFEPLNTFETFRLRNFWRSDYYIYQQEGRITAGPVNADALGSHWHIEDVINNSLLVPIHLDALWLPHDQAVSAPLADFSRLPYFDGIRDVNPNTANISEQVLNPAQQPPQLYLRSGLHLHWALPDALHRGVQWPPNKLRFFSAPDRWLVTKKINGASSQWVVESNYLHPPGDSELETAISYPHQDGSNPHPFRYLGRKLPLAEWSETDSLGTNPNYLHTLTAVGYGEPTFAAFYPNCHSVFGFYDEESAGKSVLELRGVQYEVIGWHSAAGADVLQDSYFLTRVEALRTGHQATLVTAPYQFETLKSEMGWIVEGAENTAFANATVYFARLTLAADAVPDPKDRRPQATIAIGNSATEALSAHLGLEIGGNDKSILEEQLEALHLMPELEGQQLDTGPKFREARHTQGFKAVHGGLISTFKPGSNPSGEANAQSAPNQAQVTLPDDLAFRLNALNTARQRHDRAIAERETLREQLFSDWYKYMVAAYPPEDARDDFPDMDEISYFIKQRSFKELGAIGQEIVSLGSQLQVAEAQFSRAVDNLQRIVVGDIRHWGRLLALLSGRDSPQFELFRMVFERVRNALPDGLRPLLARDSDQAPPISNSEKEDLVAGINTIIDNIPAGLVTDEVVPQLPAEAQELLAQRDPPLTPAERRRIGRLILETALPETLSRRPSYVVDEIPAPRYWQPTEPVVLIADSDLKLTERHGEDGRLRDDNLLACYLSTHAQTPGTDSVSSPISNLINDVRARIDELQAAVVADDNEPATARIGFYTWRQQPWHPFMLEWTVELFPLKESGSHSAIDRQYQSDFLNSHYDFPEESVDLVFKHTRSSLTRSANLYSGRSLMLDYAQPLLVERLQDYCTKHLAPLYYDANDVPPAERRNKPPLEVITAWAQENRERLSPFNQAVLDIQNHLAQSQSPPIAQALSGFNAALLQHEQTLQLPIGDPLGFPDAKALAGEVSERVGRTNRRAPQPLNDFNPLRAGALRLQHLRLVDTFGRVQTLLDDKTRQPLVPSQPFRKIGNDTVMLPPRLVQPARLNFNWLGANPGAEGGAIMMNAHPATSPVCGWMMPNYLDNSLLVYSQAGQPLGALQSRGDGVAWSSAPGRQHRILEIDVSNEHLYRLVSHFLSQNYNFLDDVLTALESALENIMPASGAEHDSLALLVGRPLAVVRASLDLEIKGRLATNQDWNLFRRTLQTGTRNSDGFAAVSFPLRIGEHGRLNDGLLGFWIENNGTNNPAEPYVDNKLYLPQTPNTPRTGSIDHPDIVMHRGTVTPHIQQAIGTPRRTMTMLVDPRAAVHITSGILPLQSLSIPPDQYMPALRNLEMTFFSGPFLTKLDGIELPLPTEPGFTWSALTKENGAWADTHAIDPVEQNATFSAPHMIREGWLKLTREMMNDK